MVRIMTFILSLVFLMVGFLGLTTLLPMLTTYPNLSNIGAMILAVLVMLVLIYARRNEGAQQQKIILSQERTENAQLRKETHDQSQKESEQLKAEISQLKEENSQLRDKLKQHSLQSNNDEIKN